MYWSPASRTALAEAELDYVDQHESTAAYVAFRLLGAASDVGGGGGSGGGGDTLAGLPFDASDDVSLLIWTTTPWTLNQAVCANADLAYALVDGAPDGNRLLIAEATVEEVGAALGTPLTVRATASGSALAGRVRAPALGAGGAASLRRARHRRRRHGAVHRTAHGPDDFHVGCAHGLSTVCPVDEQGRFTAAVAEAAPFGSRCWQAATRLCSASCAAEVRASPRRPTCTIPVRLALQTPVISA